MGNKASALPYDVGDRVCSIGGDCAGWALHEGKRKRDGEPVSVFRFEKKGADARQKELAENFVKRVKTLRHPHVLAYVDGLDTDAETCVVTESVVTLESWLADLRKSESDDKVQMAISWGMHCALEALGFMNEDCNLAHGSVSLESILVTKGGDWKLGGMFVVGEMGGIEGPSRLFRDCPGIVPSRYKPPERLQSKWSALTPVGVDVWALGCVLYEAFNGPVSNPDDLITKKGALPQNLHKAYEAMMSHAPGSRPSPKRLYASAGFKAMFRNNLFLTLRFLEELQLKSDAERIPFLQSLASATDTFPRATCCYKILPALRDIIIPGGPGGAAAAAGGAPPVPSALAGVVLQPFLKISGMLDATEEVQRLVVPTVVSLFASNDRATRVALLQRLSLYIEHVDDKVINSKLFASICTGFKDTAPVLRELTVKSVVALAPHLDSKNVNEVLLRHLVGVLKDIEPAIRTNTLICLAKIMPSLNEETRKKVILGSFPLATRDQFVPARLAALRGLSGGLVYVEDDAQALAGKVIPSLAFALVDPSPEVRVQAFAVVDAVLAKLRAISDERAKQQKIDEEEQRKRDLAAHQGGEIRVAPGAAAGSASAVGSAPAGQAQEPAGLLSAAAGWAVGSISKSWSGSGQAAPSLSAAAAKPAAPNGPSAGMPQAGLRLSAASQAPLVPKPLAANDGWDDGDVDLLTGGSASASGWDDGDNDDLDLLSGMVSKTSVKKTASGHLDVRHALGTSGGGDVDDFFGSLAGPSKPLQKPATKAATKLGVSLAKPPSATGAESSMTADERRIAAEQKREEARKRLLQRREARKSGAVNAKPVVAKKASGGDDWDNW